MSEEEKDLNETMEAIDPEEYKKMLQQPKEQDHSDLEDIITPIEVKSTRHLQIQQEQLEKEKAKENAAKNAHTAVNEVYDWFESLLMAVVFIVLLFTFIIRVNTVDGGSMTPTLQNGQKLVVTDLFYTPSYNDIVIIQAAKLDGGKPIVKRIIGLPGDTVMIDFEAGLVYRNGEQLPVETKEGYLFEDGHKINSYTNRNIEMLSKTEYTVPENCYFVLGDNRNGSKDSRAFSSIGFVDGNYIAGRAIFSLFPFSTFGTV
ncbi:MAG TPA: signal peptidase I [Ruminococcaceae bacterium]|nr:signal peptidase I [Oscillospiraceae bacterium]